MFKVEERMRSDHHGTLLGACTRGTRPTAPAPVQDFCEAIRVRLLNYFCEKYGDAENLMLVSYLIHNMTCIYKFLVKLIICSILEDFIHVFARLWGPRDRINSFHYPYLNTPVGTAATFWANADVNKSAVL